MAGAAGSAEAAARAAAELPNQRYDPAIAAGALVAHPLGLLHDDAGGGDGSANEGNDDSRIGTMMMWTSDGKKKKRKRQGGRSGASPMYTPSTHPPRAVG